MTLLRIILKRDIKDKEMKKELKILVLVLSSNEYPAWLNRIFQRKTWSRVNDKNIEIIFYKGGAKKVLYRKNILHLKSGTKFSEIGHKTIDSFDWIEKNIEYDLVFRTSASSYVDIQNLVSYVKRNYQKNFYAGVKTTANYFENDIDFAAGSGYFLDRNLIKLILKNKNQWDHRLIDDVALGKLMSELNINLINFDRNSINTFPLYNQMNYQYFLTRCKVNQFNLPRFLEGLFMLKIHNNYLISRNIKKTSTFFEKSCFLIIRAIQKIYPRKLFPSMQNKQYKKYIKSLYE
jgi:hypothetical protein